MNNKQLPERVVFSIRHDCTCKWVASLANVSHFKGEKLWHVFVSIRCYLLRHWAFKVTHSIVVIWVKIFKTEKTIKIHLVRLTEVCGKVLSEKYAYKSVKTAL